MEGIIEVRIADRARMEAIGKGRVIFCSKSGTMVTVKKIFHIPNLGRRLLSVPMIAQHGLDMRLVANQCDINRGNDLVVSAKSEGNVDTLNVEHESAMVVEQKKAESKWELWHARMGHPSHDVR